MSELERMPGIMELDDSEKKKEFDTFPLEDRIEAFVVSRQGVSFLELEQFFGEEFKGDYAFGDVKRNIYFWFGMSNKFMDALMALGKGKRVFMRPAHVIIYAMDGVLPRLPLVKRPRAYKEPHWLPATFSTTPYPKEKKKIRKGAGFR